MNSNTFTVFASVTNTIKVLGGTKMDMRVIDHQVKVQEWRRIITECRSSGMSISKWCSDNGIKPNQYYYWLRIIRNEGNGDRYRFPPFPYISTGRNGFHFPSTRGKQVIWSGFFNFFLVVFARSCNLGTGPKLQNMMYCLNDCWSFNFLF